MADNWYLNLLVSIRIMVYVSRITLTDRNECLSRRLPPAPASWTPAAARSIRFTTAIEAAGQRLREEQVKTNGLILGSQPYNSLSYCVKQ